MNMEIQPKLINALTGRDEVYNDERIVSFLFEHLDEYGDKKKIFNVVLTMCMIKVVLFYLG